MAALTSRYARAFADVIVGRKLDATKSVAELRDIEGVLRESEALRTVWDNPSVEHAQKLKVLDAIAAKLKTSKLVRNFVAVIIDHHRIAALPEIANELQEELNERFGLAEARVTTMRELSAKEKQALEAQLAKLTGRRVLAHYATDRTILGGAVVQVGSTIYDGSVKGQLEKLKEELAQG
jgi:F-type H+-transporting ATPase subunit delta